jgi:peroxin-3
MLLGGMLCVWVGVDGCLPTRTVHHFCPGRKQVHYDRNEQAGNIAVEAVLPEIRAAVEEHLSSEELIATLKREQKADTAGENRAGVLARWDEVKVVVFTELVASAYSLSLMVLFLRVQLNILGGYLFVRASGGTGVDGLPTMSPETQKAYLKQAEHLRKHGVAALIDKLRPRVHALMAAHPIKENPTFDLVALSKCLTDAQAAFEGGGAVEGSMFADFTFAGTLPEEATSPTPGGLTLELLMNETRDIVDSAPFVDALHACVSTCLKHVSDNLGVKVFSKSAKKELVKLVPSVHKEAHALFHHTAGPMKELLDVKEVQELSSRVYESFCDASP